MAKKKADDYREVLESGLLQLESPVKLDEKEITVLDFPLRKFNGQHYRLAMRNYEHIEGEMQTVAEFNRVFQAYLAAALMGVSPDFVFDMKTADFTRITMFVQSFLLNGGS